MSRLSCHEHYCGSLYRVAMQWCRGPLPAGHPRRGVVYFCPDGDVPLAASNLSCTPVLKKYAYTDKEAVLLDAHRAPDDWFASACQMPRLTICGDPCAWRPRSCNLFAHELDKQECTCTLRAPQIECVPTISAALSLMRGISIILCGTREVRDAIYAHLRPSGALAGDGARDRFGKYTQLAEAPRGQSVSVDGGRRMVRLDQLEQHMVVSPSMLRSCEYDTVVVMPDVPCPYARAVCRRTRYMVVGVAHSPLGYV